MNALPASEPPRGFVDLAARSEFWRLAAIIFLTAMTNQQSVLLAVVWEEAGFPHRDIGLLIAVYGIPLVLMSLFSGPLANRIGILQTVRIGAVLTTLGFISLYFTHETFLGSLASRLVQGTGFALFHAPVMTYGSTRLTRERFVRLFGLLSAMAPLPYAFGPILAEVLYHAFGSNGYFIAGAIPAVLGLPLLWTIRPVDRTEGPVGGIAGLLRNPRIWLPLLAAVVYGYMFGFISAYAAPFLVERGIIVGAFFTAFTISIFAVRFGGLALIENVDRRAVVAGGAMLLAAGLVLVALAQSITGVVVAGFVFGLGHSIGFPVLSAWICDGTPPEQRATPMAVFNATFFAAMTVIALPASLAIGAVGYVPVMIGLSVSAVGLAVVLVYAWSRRFRR
ncbi:MAG: MFS transporter [Phreatobacter sp.]|uniref:MFS transporter n=1 Tax=Phreatobacter sp. TaxID=1966341 RepID=UPI004037595E